MEQPFFPPDEEASEFLGSWRDFHKDGTYALPEHMELNNVGSYLQAVDTHLLIVMKAVIAIRRWSVQLLQPSPLHPCHSQATVTTSLVLVTILPTVDCDTPLFYRVEAYAGSGTHATTVHVNRGR